MLSLRNVAQGFGLFGASEGWPTPTNQINSEGSMTRQNHYTGAVFVQALRLSKLKSTNASRVPLVVAFALTSLVGEQAAAQEECGAYSDANTPIVCDGSFSGGEVLYLDVEGIDFSVDGATGLEDVLISSPNSTNPVNIDLISGQIGSSDGSLSGGLTVNAAGEINLIIRDVEINDWDRSGIYSVTLRDTPLSGSQNMLLTVEDGFVLNRRAGSFGGVAAENSNGPGDAVVVINGGLFEVEGVSSSGNVNFFTIGAKTDNFTQNGGDSRTVVSGGEFRVSANRFAWGVNASTESVQEGETSVSISGGRIETNSLQGYGASVLVRPENSLSRAMMAVSGGEVLTVGASSSAMWLWNIGDAETSATVQNAALRTQSDDSHGIWANVAGNSSWFSGVPRAVNATNVSLVSIAIGEGADISTLGNNAVGAFAQHSGLGDVQINMLGGNIRTGDEDMLAGEGAHGLYALADNQNSEATVQVVMEGGIIETLGSGSLTEVAAHGVFGAHTGNGIVRLDVTGGEIMAMGEDSDALRAVSANGNTEVFVDTVITGGSGNGVGINTQTADGMVSSVIIGANAEVSSVANVSFRNNGGDSVVTTRGTVIGDAILGMGDDAFFLENGSFDGDVFGDAVLASNDDGDDTFQWTGGEFLSSFFGSNGSDTALVTAGSYDGTYHLLDGGDDYSSTADGWTDELTLAGDVSGDVNGTNILNWERVILDSVDLRVADGAIEVGTDSADGLFLINGSILNQSGIGLNLNGNFTNNGVLTTQNGIAGDVVVVGGMYNGAVGQFLLDVDLAVDTSDVLRIGEDVSGAATELFIADATTGTATGNDVLVVDVVGATGEGDFVLASGPIQRGIFAYNLGLVGTQWFLQASVSPEAAPLEVYPSTLLDLTRLPSLQERVGNRHWAGAAAELEYEYCANLSHQFGCTALVEQQHSDANATDDSFIEGQGVWVRLDGARTDYVPIASTLGARYVARISGIQLGYDHVLHETAGGSRLIGGLNLSYRNSRADVNARAGSGVITTDGFGLGASLTWYEQNGLYFDGQAQFMSMTSDLGTSSIGTFADGNAVRGYAVSLEVGREFPLNENWAVTPQAQLSYASVEEEDYSDSFGTVASFHEESVRLRIGLEASNEESWVEDDGTTSRQSVRVGVNLIREFQPDTFVRMPNSTLHSEGDELIGEITLGGSYNWSDDRHSLYGQVAGSTGLGDFGDSTRLRGTVGFRTRWE
jgi:outer membrane autotransporter protein